MESVLVCFRKYFDFSGRARRQEFIMFNMFIAIIGIIFAFIDSNTGTLNLVWALVVFIPALSLSVRRIHDIGISGWMCLLLIIPIVNMIFLIYMTFKNGNSGTNKYGKNPKIIVGISI